MEIDKAVLDFKTNKIKIWSSDLSKFIEDYGLNYEFHSIILEQEE